MSVVKKLTCSSGDWAITASRMHCVRHVTRTDTLFPVSVKIQKMSWYLLFYCAIGTICWYRIVTTIWGRVLASTGAAIYVPCLVGFKTKNTHLELCIEVICVWVRLSGMIKREFGMTRRTTSQLSNYLKGSHLDVYKGFKVFKCSCPKTLCLCYC